MPSWTDAVVLAPVLEEIAFTCVPLFLLGNYAQIIAPIIFGACHVCATRQDRNFEIRIFTVTALINFIHHRVIRRDPKSELLVAIMSHALHNLIALSCMK